MELTLILVKETQDWTISNLHLNGQHECWTCEDEYREVKVKGETRIPAGRYEIKFRTVGGFHERYLKRFGADFHKGMLELQNVPGFDFILIHIGNSDRDTAGCILVGQLPNFETGRLAGSEAAYRPLYRKVSRALLKGEKVFINVLRTIKK